MRNYCEYRVFEGILHRISNLGKLEAIRELVIPSFCREKTLERYDKRKSCEPVQRYVSSR